MSLSQPKRICNKNKLNKKQKLFIILSSFIAIFGSIYSLYFLNHTKNLNVVFINLDSLRPDHLGCYGYKRDTSPNIDKLAKEGAIFTQAISQSSYTPTAIYSILTSVYPYLHGVYDFGITMNNGLQTLPGVLKSRGYYLGLISGRGRLAEFNLLELTEEFNTAYPSNSSYISADEVTQKAIKWIKLNKEKKFFLWLYYLEPHVPYRPPAPYNKLYVDDKFMENNKKSIPISDDSKQLYDSYGVIPRIAAIKDIVDVNYYISQYDGSIKFADEQIGEVLVELKKLNLYDRTLIIITSDHGEFLGEHNFYFVHSAHLYDTVIKVPLIFECNNILPKGKTVGQQVGHIDIVPTILDLLGVKARIKTSGISLCPMLLKGKVYPSRIIFSEFVNKDKILFVSLRTDEWKLIYNSSNQEYELFNLKKDPSELINLIGIEEEEKVPRLLKRKLENYIKHRILFRPENQKQILNEKTKNKLKSLGYSQ